MLLKLSLNHKRLYLAGLAIVAIGLPFSNFLISVGMIWLLGAWIIEGDLPSKFKRFRKNHSALFLTSIFLLHILGLINTSDFGYALNDMRIKLPLLILPLVFSSMPPLNRKEIRYLMYTFVTAVFVSSLICFLVYLHVLFPERYVNDVRDISIFISHIRLGLMISFSIMILVYLFYKNHTNKKPIHALFAFWFLAFLYIMESFTGFTTLILGSVILLGIYAVRFKEISMKLLCVIVAMAISVGSYFYLESHVREYYTVYEELNELDTYSPDGEKYQHYDSDQLENGYYVYKHIAHKELKKAWNERSEIDFEGLDEKGQPIFGTIIRYLTSKGLRKDRNGVYRLTSHDIDNIEAGIPNVRYKSNGLSRRINETLFFIDVYINTGDPSGHSLTQRLEYWRNGWSIVAHNFMFGVGTGDVQAAFNQAYVNNDTKMNPGDWHRAHNQFLTFFITFGVAGLIWFLFAIVYPVIRERGLVDFYFLSFFVIAMISFIWEDTLETQAGVSFFAFFYCLFLLARNKSGDHVIRATVKTEEEILE